MYVVLKEYTPFFEIVFLITILLARNYLFIVHFAPFRYKSNNLYREKIKYKHLTFYILKKLLIIR